MVRRRIIPPEKHSMWTVPPAFAEMAQRFFSEAQELESAIEVKDQELTSHFASMQPPMSDFEIWGSVREALKEEEQRLVALCSAAQVLACMEVEAFLNGYGVRTLGEKYYKRTLERLGIVQKLDLLLAICVGELTSEKSQVTALVRRMFERRNGLVHPKTREVMRDGEYHFPPRLDPLKDARDAISEMRMFYVEFGKIDPKDPHLLPSL